MKSRLHHRIAITLMAILLQLHAVAVLAMPCGQCLPGDVAAAVPPCHSGNAMPMAGAADESVEQQADDQRCSHCSGGACGSVVTLLPPLDAAPAASFSSLFTSVLLPPASPPGQSSLPYRPPIL